MCQWDPSTLNLVNTLLSLYFSSNVLGGVLCRVWRKMGLTYCERTLQQGACLEASQAAPALPSPGHHELGISSPGVEKRWPEKALFSTDYKTRGITSLHIPLLFSCLRRLMHSVIKLMSARMNTMLRTPETRTRVFTFELKPGEQRSYQC